MRGGRILDSGSPSELIDRYGRRATISFTLTEPTTRSLHLLDVDGVHDVQFEADRVTVQGDRTSIAHVGAALVRAGTVPADLTVEVPDLEDVLIGLLEQPEPAWAQPTLTRDPIGAST
jgi:ABC-type multidrug transport system ATPase subunit